MFSRNYPEHAFLEDLTDTVTELRECAKVGDLKGMTAEVNWLNGIIGRYKDQLKTNAKEEQDEHNQP